MLTTTEGKQHISANIRRRLAELNWNQADLARATGEGEMRISKLLNAEHVPTAVFLYNVAEAIGLPVSDLYLRPPKKSRK